MKLVFEALWKTIVLIVQVIALIGAVAGCLLAMVWLAQTYGGVGLTIFGSIIAFLMVWYMKYEELRMNQCRAYDDIYPEIDSRT